MYDAPRCQPIKTAHLELKISVMRANPFVQANYTCFLLCLLFVAACLGVHCPSIEGQEFANIDANKDWPWWRGVHRNGQVDDRKLATHFNATENVLWKTLVPGRGHSSPIVVRDKVYLATADERQQSQSIVAFRLSDGEQLWRRRLNQGAFPTNNHPKNTEASSTIASDGRSLWITFFHHKQIELICLDLDGETKWREKVCNFNPQKYEYGYAPSPLLYKDLVIVSAEYDGPSGIAAYDQATGQRRWIANRPNNITFSSPVVAEVAGRDQLLLSGSQMVNSYDPTTGKLLWSVPGTTAATCGTMVWDGDLVFASGGYPKAETIAVRADGSNQVVWKNRQKCYEQSMIVVDGHLYGLTDQGVLYCWEAQTGTERWRTRLQGKVSSSPIAAGGLIYWANEAGTMYVFRANPDQFELIAENRVGNEAFASPAVAGNKLLLRIAEGRQSNRQEYLLCIGEDNE